MNAKENLSNRFGERLIAANYITQEDCEAALAYQKEAGGLFGSALIRLGILTKEKLDEFLNFGQLSWSGERMLQGGLITREQLNEALSFQAENGGRLGNALIALGFVSKERIDEFFRSSPAPSAMRLGERLVLDGGISQSNLDRALKFQEASGGKLGEILLSLGLATPEQVLRAVATQLSLGRVGNNLNFADARKLPYNVALKYNAIIANTRDDSYILAVAAQLPPDNIAEIEKYLDKPVEQVLATMPEIENFWDAVYPTDQSDQSVYQLHNEQPVNSALETLTLWQKIFGICAVVLLALLLVFEPTWTLLIINVVVQITYFFFTIAKVYIISRGLSRRNHLRYSKQQIAAISDKDLPIYTLLIPVYKESKVINKLIERLSALDYPHHKLDIRILLEADDEETREALQNVVLPSYFSLVNIPKTQPQTKPKACNYGLIRARGDYVVIYDAEDIPDTDQLKKAYLAFKELPENYVCIQSKLNYFNSEQNILTRWFTQEYSTWFDVLLIGTMSVDVPIPLGGTSNHFKADFLKQIGAWDPFNVTEDADLGVRLYKMDYKTAVLDSHTWEEANSNLNNWIRQRSRWIKGYMQTWLVHMRRPFHLLRELGLKGFLGYNAMVLGTPLLPLLNPIFWFLMAVWLLSKPGTLDVLFPGWLYYIALFQLIVGNFAFVYSSIYAAYCVIRDSEVKGLMRLSYSIIPSGMFLPLYWVLMSVAGYKALVQLFTRPHFWEKTLHGLTDQTEVKVVEAPKVNLRIKPFDGGES